MSQAWFFAGINYLIEGMFFGLLVLIYIRLGYILQTLYVSKGQYVWEREKERIHNE